jgi:membrane protease YdiL (CAAX protease family)
MNDHESYVGEERPPDAAPPRRSPLLGIITGTISWAVIAAFVALSLIGGRILSKKEAKADQTSPADMDIQGRYLVGAAQMTGADKNSLLQQLPAGDKASRGRAAVVHGELAGPKAALEKLTPPDDLSPTEQILLRLYKDYERELWTGPGITDQERHTLKNELGWYGELALAPAGGSDKAARERVLEPASRTVFVLLGVTFGGISVAILGFFGLLIFGAMAAMGHVHSNMGRGGGRVAVWVETFVVYMILFAVIGLGLSLIRKHVNEAALSGLAAILSLGALLWPRIRGVSWREIRQAIGWTSGRGILREIAAGFATYIMMTPVMVIGFLIMMVLMHFLKGKPGFEQPSHPIVPLLIHSGWGTRLMVLLLASVIAPIVEETMFRGVLYRHLREATAKWAIALSVFVSVLPVGFVFAAIHPQGLLGIPVLMGMSLSLNLGREWRGTLIPSMIAHGLSNGMVMCLTLLALA